MGDTWPMHKGAGLPFAKETPPEGGGEVQLSWYDPPSAMNRGP